MKDMPRVLHFSPFAGMDSGANISMLTLVEQLASRGPAFVFTTCRGELYQAAKGIGAVAGYAFEKWPSMHLIRGPWTVMCLLRFARRHHIDVVNSHSALGNHYCKFVRALAHIPLVTHQRDNYCDDYFHNDLGSADHIVAITNFVAENLPDAMRNKTSVLLNPVRPPREDLPSGGGDVRSIGMAARCNPIKGMDILIEAVLPILEQRSDLNLEIWGYADNDYGRELRGLTQKSSEDVQGRIRLVPFRVDITEFFRRVDIVAVPSRFREPMGRVPVEAMLHRRPVVAANHGGLPEVVQNDVTGLLFDPGSVVALRKQLLRLLEDSQLRRRLVVAGYERAISAHDPRSYADKMVALYKRLAGQ